MKTKKLFILILTLFVFLSTLNIDTTHAAGSIKIQHKDDICSKTLSIVCDKNGNFS